MNEGCVCFTGHRDLQDPDKTRMTVRQLIPQLFAGGYHCFITGGALGFDTVVAEEVLRFAKSEPRAKLCLALSSREQPDGWEASEKKHYWEIVDDAATHTFVTEHGTGTPVYYARNRFMVDHASLCVAWLEHRSGGTFMTVNYAMSQGVRVLNIADSDSGTGKI